MTDTLPIVYHKKRPEFKEEAKDALYHLPNYATNYVKSLFPIAGWIGRYNLIWLAGDLIAGLTAGAVVIPQGMAYAKVAGLPPEYGLYSSFVGVSIYFLFATSKGQFFFFFLLSFLFQLLPVVLKRNLFN
jgi:sodium-independent sulfate anion transporter 11